ncbi:MAG: menaquinone biosynthesis family protein [Mariniblastus sp.]
MSSSNQPIQLAISTCPNDTFAFHGILAGKVDCKGLEFDVQLLDIQQLNDGLFAEKFDVAKASFHAAALLSDRTIVLPSGSALGFGVGPLLLASDPNTGPNKVSQQTANPQPSLTLCPGEHTTAAMLFQLFYSEAVASGKTKVAHKLFSDIMPELQNKTADFGVCIHEGRFTWESEGLSLVEDLGTRWEKETQSPLPLGGILARRNLGDELIGEIQSVIQASIKYGLGNRDETIATMRKYAQEFHDAVLMKHVDLYVNDWTVELGEVGSKALKVLSAKAKQCGLIPENSRDIEVFDLKI